MVEPSDADVEKQDTRITNGPSWTKRAFWYFCSAQSSVFVQATPTTIIAESYPSLDISTLGHVLMAILWVGAVAAYAIFVTYQHFTLPDLQTFVHSPTELYDPLEVQVEAWCSNPPHCGDIVISADYSTSSSLQCNKIPPQSHRILANESGTENGATTRQTTMKLCYTGEHIFTTNNDDPLPGSLGIVVDFRSIDPGYNASGGSTGRAAQGGVRLRSPSSSSNQLDKLLNIESWQVKKLILGQNIKYEYGAKVLQEGYPMTVQYEGRRPSRRANAVISLASYADVTTVKKRAANLTVFGLMGLFGTCCGMAFMMNSLNVYLIAVFKKFFPGPAELARREAAEKEKQKGGHEEELLAANMLSDDGIQQMQSTSKNVGEQEVELKQCLPEKNGDTAAHDDEATRRQDEGEDSQTQKRSAAPPPQQRVETQQLL